MNLRIGPYVCAEWSWGGYPYDISQIPGLHTRSSNPQWEAWMRTLVLNVTREFRHYFADRGGPIVLAQVENELHTSDQPYIDFCGALASETGTAIPWEMCNGNSADNTINSCNGGDCTSFIEQNGQNGKVLISEPALWTENWMGWFAGWGDGGPAGNWPAYDSSGQSASKSAGIMRWYARGGSHINMYNWAGGNHFARNAGSSMVGIYYWDAPLASDNLAQGPERMHIANTFSAFATVSESLLVLPAQNKREVPLAWFDAQGVAHAADRKHVAYVYGDVAFLENTGDGSAQTMVWRSCNFSTANQEVVLVSSNCSVIFNSHLVQPTHTQRVWTPIEDALGPWVFWADPVL